MTKVCASVEELKLKESQFSCFLVHDLCEYRSGKYEIIIFVDGLFKQGRILRYQNMLAHKLVEAMKLMYPESFVRVFNSNVFGFASIE